MPRGRVLAFLMVVAGTACRPAPPVEVHPPGFVFRGPRAHLGPVLERLANMNATPIGRAAAASRTRIDGCDRVAGQGEDPVAFLEGLACDTSTSRSDLWALPALGGQRFIGGAEVTPAGGVQVKGTLVPIEGPDGTFALDDAPPTTSILRAARRAVWAHVRVDGDFDPSRLMPSAGGQADDLFAVNSALALRGLTTGEIEFGLYPPQEGRSFPVSVVAAGIRTQTGARAALASLVERLEKRWSTKAIDALIAGRPATCLPEVNILPEFAPCAIVTDDDLIIGWNAYALEVGLADPAEVVNANVHTVAFDFAHFVEADAQLERALADGRPVLKQPYPWSMMRLTVDGGDTPAAVLRLEGPSL